MKVLCFALFACAFNLLLGYTGLLSFGHAAFLGGSAYVAGHAMKVWSLTPELGPARRHADRRAAGAGVRRLAIRRQGIYFAMITLALAQMLFFVACRRRSPAARTACRACRAASSSACSTCRTT